MHWVERLPLSTHPMVTPFSEVVVGDGRVVSITISFKVHREGYETRVLGSYLFLFGGRV